MAPVPPNGTDRVFMDYTSYDIPHTLILRLPPVSTPADGEAVAAAAATILKQRMSVNDSFTAARYQQSGTNFSLPIAFTAQQGVVDPSGGSALWQEDPESAFITFIGRGSATGKRVRWEFFTSVRTTTWPGDNRYNPGESGPIDALRTNWTNFVEVGATATQQIVTIAADIPVCYDYVNIGKNAYWQRKQR
jgi:hypothetical protein